jgi:hypothetical protein
MFCAANLVAAKKKRIIFLQETSENIFLVLRVLQNRIFSSFKQKYSISFNVFHKFLSHAEVTIQAIMYVCVKKNCQQ